MMFEPEPFQPVYFYSHLLMRTLGLLRAMIALASQKGSKIHILGGRVMFVGITISSITVLIFVLTKFGVPQIVNAITALCGLTAAILVFQSSSPVVRLAERTLIGISAILLVWFSIHAIPTILSGEVIFIGPVSFALIPIIFFIGDIHFHLNPNKRSLLRVRHHMSPMIWTLAVAIRAPMFELREKLRVPLPVVLIAPILGALILHILFWKKAHGMAPLLPPVNAGQHV